MVTLCITSCGRLDLLRKTVDSLNSTTAWSFYRKILIDDSGVAEIHKKLIEEFSEFDIILPQKQGQLKCIDDLYGLVRTPYIFHCEDDWLFDGNRYFIGDSLDILAHRKDIHQVWVRAMFDHHHPLIDNIETIPDSFTPQRDISFKELVKDYQGFWNGFSFNPGLRRLSDYHKMFPRGYRVFHDEAECAKHAAKFDYKAVQLLNTSCHHIGWGRHI